MTPEAGSVLVADEQANRFGLRDQSSGFAWFPKTWRCESRSWRWRRNLRGRRSLSGGTGTSLPPRHPSRQRSQRRRCRRRTPARREPTGRAVGDHRCIAPRAVDADLAGTTGTDQPADSYSPPCLTRLEREAGAVACPASRAGTARSINARLSSLGAARASLAANLPPTAVGGGRS
jgi:hypothetical protein